MCGWSRGLVKSVADLYRPDIFGATQNLRCECGALTGAQNVGNLCAECGVFVEADATAARRRYVGLFHFGPGHGLYRHPYTKEEILEFLIPPIGYRVAADGMPNSLGRKVATLVALVADIEARYSRASSDERAYLLQMNQPIDQLLEDIVGVFGPPRASDSAADSADTLLSLFYQAIKTLDPSVGVLARCCGLRLDVSATM